MEVGQKEKDSEKLPVEVTGACCAGGAPQGALQDGGG